VLQGEGGLFVYVIGQDRKIELRPVEVGDWYLDGWIITKGVNEGDSVVVGGLNRISKGALVEVTHWVNP
jgi:membrane fusion protein (multidrug efflux system)